MIKLIEPSHCEILGPFWHMLDDLSPCLQARQTGRNFSPGITGWMDGWEIQWRVMQGGSEDSHGCIDPLIHSGGVR